MTFTQGVALGYHISRPLALRTWSFDTGSETGWAACLNSGARHAGGPCNEEERQWETKPFQGSTVVDLPVPCSFDFNVAAAKYFAGLEDGEVPLNLMFSGTVFYETAADVLQVEQIPWDREAKYRLPVQIWKDMMDIYYPNSAWLCLRRDVFNKLSQYKMDRGIPTWEQALESLLKEQGGTRINAREDQDANSSLAAHGS